MGGEASGDVYLARTGKLMEIIDRAGYVAMRIEKSPDGMAVKGFTPIDEFPDRVWTQEQAEDCDYLLVPGTDRGQVESGLLPAISAAH
jgi:hypothetical protein